MRSFSQVRRVLVPSYLKSFRQHLTGISVLYHPRISIPCQTISPPPNTSPRCVSVRQFLCERNASLPKRLARLENTHTHKKRGFCINLAIKFPDHGTKISPARRAVVVSTLSLPRSFFCRKPKHGMQTRRMSSANENSAKNACAHSSR